MQQHRTRHAYIYSVDLPVMDVESSLSQLLLPGVKALQVTNVVPHPTAAELSLASNNSQKKHSLATKSQSLTDFERSVTRQLEEVPNQLKW